MIILIDAYNLLKKIFSGEITHMQRKNFVAYYGAYAKRKGHHVVIVFDGGDSYWPSSSKQTLSEIVYAGQSKSADDYIREYISANKGKEIVLVSSDRQLCIFANQQGVISIDSDIFYRLTQKQETPLVLKAQVGKAVKISDSGNQELDMLMEEAAQSIEFKKEDSQKQVAKKTVEASKQERRLIEIIKKL